jgi:hypothetical protein
MSFLRWRYCTFVSATANTVVWLILASAASAITIDDFSVGPIEVSRTGSVAATAVQSGLDPSHVLGGGRDITVGEFGTSGQTLIVDTALRELQFSPGSSSGYFQVNYGSMAQPLNVDLTAGGSNAFLFHFIYNVPNFPTSLPPSSIRVFTATGSGFTALNHSGGSITMLPDGSRRARIPFSTLGNLDLTAVQRIEFELFRVSPGTEFVLKAIATVPEPSCLALFTLGLCGGRYVVRLPASRRPFVR